MRRELSPFHRSGRARSALVLAIPLLLAALLLAGSASAVPITETVRYNGPSGFGLSEADALASALPKISSQGLQQLEGVDPSVLSPVRNVVIGPPATATEDWLLTNNGGGDLVGDVLLVFATPLENDAVSPPAVYQPDEVSLMLQNGAGGPDWFLIEAFDDGLGTLHYPAVSVGSLANGASSGFSLDYVLDDPHVVFGPGGETLVLPKWQVFPLFRPVPEPSTALLVAGCVAGLVLGRRRRA